jgi:hypothetical protein
MAMIDILCSMGVVDPVNLQAAKVAKFQRLKQWSNIQNLENI